MPNVTAMRGPMWMCVFPGKSPSRKFFRTIRHNRGRMGLVGASAGLTILHRSLFALWKGRDEAAWPVADRGYEGSLPRPLVSRGARQRDSPRWRAGHLYRGAFEARYLRVGFG